MKLGVVFLVCLLVGVVCADIFPIVPGRQEFKIGFGKVIDDKASNDKWWEGGSFYQIYPRSFKDSDGNGIGDLKGIIEKLPYLKEIGVTATWLSPIFSSPMADFGYDISNFTEIDKTFGTMEDFEALIKKANEVGVKIILDFVPNHSSDECEWFQKSIKRDPEFEDFYVWHPGKVDKNGVRRPPSNWVSLFRGSAWTWNEVRQEYYLHQFVAKQPDLNYRNPKVREYMNEVLRFWLKKGVAGFRCDIVPNCFEVAPDAEGNYPDEPVNEWNNDPEDYGHLQHIYTTDQPETIHLVYEWRQVLEDFRKEHNSDEKILMIETWSPIDIVMQYFGNETAEGAQFPFNFQMISRLNGNSNAHDYAESINLWLDKMPKGRTANWVIGNHDKNRVGSRMGVDRIDLFNVLMQSLPGCSVTYQGEEIGMTDVWIPWEDTVDPQACQADPSLLAEKSRDPCRTPFQWSDEENAGFSSNSSTWLPISDLYKDVNVKKERGIAYSHLNVYKQLQALRHEVTMKKGDAEVKAVDENVLAIKRSLANNYTYVVLLNINRNVESVNLNSLFSNISSQLEYVVVTSKSVRRVGDKTYADQVTLLPNEAVVLRTIM